MTINCMNTKEVSLMVGKNVSYCSRWAKKNGVERILVKGILAYNWTEEDVRLLGVKKERKKK